MTPTNITTSHLARVALAAVVSLAVAGGAAHAASSHDNGGSRGNGATRGITIPSVPVTVTNTTTNPVPITGTVNLAGNPGPVVITGTVNVAGTGNAGNPADAAPSQPFQVELTNSAPTYSVPTGKRLVIEELSGRAVIYGGLACATYNNPPCYAMSLQPGNDYATASLTTTVAGNDAPYTLPLSVYDQTSQYGPTKATLAALQTVHLYADPGTTLSADMLYALNGANASSASTLNGSTTTQPLDWAVSVSGYLVNAQ